ncbi:MAG: alanine racemase [Gammaproteobacteria bacterium]
MARPLKALISKTALQHNLNVVRQLTQNAKIIAMVKANAYGHGLIQVAQALESFGVDALGVACIEEAIQLRESGVESAIVLMEGFFEPQELALIQEFNLIAVVHHEEQLKILEASLGALSFKSGSPISLWLKINTGMHRLGLALDQAALAWDRLESLNSKNKITNKNSLEILGFMTHFAVAEALDNPDHVAYTQAQMIKFQKAIGHLPGARSLANSAGILGWKDSHADWVRPGLMLYGASPFPDKNPQSLNLIPAMELKSALIAIHALKKDERLGYGLIYTCPEDMLVGIVAIGYGDGFPRLAPTGTRILVGGQLTSLIGRVSMDMIAVDLRPCHNPYIGQEVELWGHHLGVEQVAQDMNTSAYELLASFSPRVPLIMV